MWNAKVGSYVSKMILDYQKKKKKKLKRKTFVYNNPQAE